MSQENVEIVRRAYAALADRDWDALFRFVHPEFARVTQLPGSYRGTEDARRFIEDQIGAFQTWTAEPEEFFEGLDRVVALFGPTLNPEAAAPRSRSRSRLDLSGWKGADDRDLSKASACSRGRRAV
jgi:hypothetical protein